MKANRNIDFSAIEWASIKDKKAEFIYNEAIARLDSIHKNNDGITNKALGILSFSMPILTALVGFFALQWGALSAPLFAASVCSAIFLFVIHVLLLFILLPRGLNSAQGEPAAYFTGGYYKNNMDDILRGNIQTVHQYIIEDSKILYFRGNLFKAVIVLFAAFPFVAAVVWAVVSACSNR
jgi:hypothetical protein